MKKFALLCGVLMLFSAVASAQDAPKAEAFLGYSYIHLNSSGTTANGNGGSGSIAFNPNQWFGVVGDFGGYTGSSKGFNGTLYSYMFGPKFAFRSDRITPYVQTLFGGAHVSGGGTSSNAFAMTLGGGLDVNATPHVAIRLIQAEYFMTRFKGGTSNTQNNARISAGIVFKF